MENTKKHTKKNKRVKFIKVLINGKVYLKNTTTNKLYTEPRIFSNRKIERNRLRAEMKKNGYKKINKNLSHEWVKYKEWKKENATKGAL